MKLPVCDITDSHGGLYMGVRWMIHGITDKNNMTYTPPSNNFSGQPIESQPEVLISFFGGARPMPVIMGSIFTGSNTRISSRISRRRRRGSTSPEHSSDVSAAEDRDLDERNHINDTFFIRNNIRESYTHTGRYEMDLKKTDEIAGIALDKQAWLRLSHQLTSDYTSPGGASEYVILGNKFLNHYEALVQNVIDLSKKLNDVVSAVNAGLPVTITIGGATSTGTTLVTDSLASHNTFTSQTDDAEKKNAFLAGVLRISERSVAEQIHNT